MAAPGNQFFIQEKLKTPAPHHASFKVLWETKWKPLCTMGVYPFMFGALKDFEPVVEGIIKKDLKPPYDWDEYAQCFIPKAEELVSTAEAAEKEGNKEKAVEFYMRASAVYRIARFPAPRSEKQRHAWTAGKDAARRGLRLHEFPMVEVEIPHTHAQQGEGSTIPAFYHVPAQASSTSRAPLVIIFCGLDGYRTELAVWKDGWARLGCATLVVEIPGTGDSPADPADPTSPDREWSSLFDWIARQDGIDQDRVVNWGVSTGGYYSIRLAHTHASKLKGVISQGGGCHFMYHPEWLSHADKLEYPFDLGRTLGYKFGYGDDFDRFLKEAMDKYSLVKDGTLDKPCTKLLLVNGTEDEIYPIDDYYVCLQHGGPKEARFVAGKKHMGEPEAFFIILEWIGKLFNIDLDVQKFMATIPFRPKY